MLRSMYSGVSGLKAHMSKMDIIGNNIANVNTTGYKGSRATFKSMLSQTIQGASAPQNGRGGTNPMQVGLGVSLGSIDKNMSQGNLKSTGRSLDFAIQGNGFFVLSDGASDLYTRAGAMSRDKEGYLVNTVNGYRVQGWMANKQGQISTKGELEDLTLKPSIPATATDKITYSGNLNASAANGTTRTTTIPVYDSQGSKHTVEVEFEKTATANEWDYTVTSVSGATIDAGNTGTLTFDASGNLDTTAAAFINPDLEITPNNGAAAGQTINLDFSQINQFAGEMTADVDTVNGSQAGSLEDFTIGQSGVITGFYDNGQRQRIGKLALANFNNPAGLSQEGDTMFRPSNNSGAAKIGEANSGGFGALSAGTLEMSNVDLSRQFTEMITAQRGFQANSKVISTSDQILQELVNLKR
ncbi:flagellar basal-body rod protein FlgF [Halobacteroides halobius DSM 5150]|uniref:Flagellar hook protein FlgE n=1 Tax=Halobacteroides halobius (strain ATCC 35273 / DSM 5150 / MD-1) TaxID=748449 RepID=L0K8D8_HALHC|nr:flagellar basal-body rod protein FlgF [Halobacteroides halobius]AGB40634.1 flagellar basal-body rod protein FlgF [Halobacteroides halobius DSM 5150]